MELGRGQKIRLGLFLTVCGVGLVAVLGTLLGLQLFSHTTMFVVRFKDSVSGLERGSPVKPSAIFILAAVRPPCCSRRSLNGS